jgi:hypothetical protein
VRDVGADVAGASGQEPCHGSVVPLELVSMREDDDTTEAVAGPIPRCLAT